MVTDVSGDVSGVVAIVVLAVCELTGTTIDNVDTHKCTDIKIYSHRCLLHALKVPLYKDYELTYFDVKLLAETEFKRCS